MAVGASKLNLIGGQGAKAVGDGRNTLAQHGGIGNDERIRFELFFVFLDEIPEADAADLFFAFDKNLYIDGELAIHLLERSQRFQMDVDLAFIVGGATTEKIAVANSGFECRGGPKIKRLRRLHRAIARKKDGGLAGGFQGLRRKQRVWV